MQASIAKAVKDAKLDPEKYQLNLDTMKFEAKPAPAAAPAPAKK
jgi:hypothetical protein